MEYERAYGNCALPKLIRDITQQSSSEHSKVLSAIQELNTWLMVPANVSTAVRAKIAIHTGYILKDCSDYRCSGILQAFLTLSHSPLGRKHLLQTRTISTLTEFFENSDANCRKNTFKLVNSIASHPNGAEFIISINMTEKCYKALELEPIIEIKLEILKILENISNFLPAEVLNLKNSFDILIGFLDAEKFSAQVVLVAISIIANLCSIQQGKMYVLGTDFIEKSIAYAKNNGFGTDINRCITKKILSAIMFSCVTTEGRKMCLEKSCVDLCMRIIIHEAKSKDPSKAKEEESDLNLVLVALRTLSLLGESPRGKAILKNDENYGQIKILANSSHKLISEIAQNTLQVIDWKA